MPGCKPHVAWVPTEVAYLDSIRVTSFVLAEFLSATKTTRTKINTISYNTRRVGTLDPNGMCEIGQTSVALCLYAGLIDRWGDES
jgi:hypothetical protein